MYRGNALETNVSATSKVSQYQRAVTPTIDAPSNSATMGQMGSGVSSINGLSSPSSSGAGIRGKVLSYNPPSTRVSSFGRANAPMPTTAGLNANSAINNHIPAYRSGFLPPAAANPDITVQGVKSAGNGGIALANLRSTSLKSSEFQDQLAISSAVPRYDLIPLSDDLPADGIIFAKIKNSGNSSSATAYTAAPGDSLVVFRTAEERIRNPERLNLDRRQLDHCPLLEQEQRLRLLNYQNNNIKYITNLENLPNLIFLDLYNNKILTLEGPLSQVKGLRVLMAGKNRIAKIANLTSLKKLDVLDLHSNEIKLVEGLDGLTDLRVLNLAGNRICQVDNLGTLVSLTELNLRRNNITHINNLQHLPALQRIFLSHNLIAQYQDISCVFALTNLIELSLDNNPLAEKDSILYRFTVLSYLTNLKHLDLKRVSDEERAQVQSNATNMTLPSLSSEIETVRSTANNSPDHQEAVEDQSVVPTSLEAKYLSTPPVSTTESKSSDNDRDSKPPSALPSPAPLPSIPAAFSTDTADDEQGAITPSALESNFEAKTGGGLAALARAGRISKGQNVFDVEILGPEEKVLIASGDKWELTVPRRLLVGVTELCLLYVRKELIVQKLNATVLQSMPALKVVRLMSNDIQSIKQVEFIPSLFAAAEHLYVRDNPINSNAEDMLQSYLIAHMPRLKTFNDSSIGSEDRRNAEKAWKAVSHIRSKAVKMFLNRNSSGSATANGGAVGDDDGADEAADSDYDTLAVTKPKPSSLAALLRNTTISKDYNTGNTSSSVNAAASLSPWQASMRNKISYGDFSKEFDGIVLDIIKQTIKELR